MKKNAYVYLHRRLDTNQVFYVGIGTIPKFKRAYNKWRRNNLWHKVVKKVNYVVDIVYKNISLEQALKYEMTLIAMYGRKNLSKGSLVNLTDGGEGSYGYKPTEETLLKLKSRPKKLGRRVINNLTGEIYDSYLVAAVKNNIPSGSIYKWLEGHRKNTSEFSYLLEENQKPQKISKARTSSKKEVYQYTTNMEFVKKWDSIKEAELFYHGKSCNITSCMSGKRKTAYGFLWKKEKVEE